jgi:hypothetical protein
VNQKSSLALSMQGVGMSSFLEAKTGPGQRTLSAFLRGPGAAPAQRATADPQGWKQTFLDAQTRQEVAFHMAEYRRWREEHPGESPTGHIWHALPGSQGEMLQSDAVEAHLWEEALATASMLCPLHTHRRGAAGYCKLMGADSCLDQYSIHKGR